MSKFYEVKDEIDEVIKHYELYDEIKPEDLENAYAIFSDEEDNVSDEEIDDDLAFFNTDMLDVNVNAIDFVGGSTTFNVKNVHTENDMFDNLCSQLNEGQRFIFNHIIRHTQELLHFESNDKESPEPFYIFLTGGGGVGKSHTIKAINEYQRRFLKFKDQRIDEQPSLQVCASTGVAAVKISGTTLHTAFKIPCQQFSPLLSNNKLHELQNKFKMLCTTKYK